jgi:hypothetical protein
LAQLQDIAVLIGEFKVGELVARFQIWVDFHCYLSVNKCL